MGLIFDWSASAVGVVLLPVAAISYVPGRWQQPQQRLLCLGVIIFVLAHLALLVIVFVEVVLLAAAAVVVVVVTAATLVA
jgi:hypothetical protein